MPFSSDSGFYLTIRLPCGRSMNGSVGGMKNYKMHFRFHRKVCDICNEISLHDFSLNEVCHHYKTKVEGYKSVGALNSIARTV